MVSSSFFLPHREDNLNDLYTIPSDHDAEASLTQSSMTDGSKIRRSYADHNNESQGFLPLLLATPQALLGICTSCCSMLNNRKNNNSSNNSINDSTDDDQGSTNKKKNAGTDNEDSLEEESSTDPATTDPSHEEQTKRTKRLFKLSWIANSFFVLGSAINVLVAFFDVQWTLGIQTIPVEVLRANDDATWQAYQRATKGHRAPQQGEEGYESVVTFSMNSNSAGSGGNSGRRNLATTTTTDAAIAAKNWMDLPFEYKHALVTLGHNEQTWDGDVASQLFWKSWYQLSEEEVEAATVLGYEEDSWNDLQPDDVDDWYWYYASTGNPTTSPTFQPTESPTTTNPTSAPTWQPTRGDGRTPWPTWEPVPEEEKNNKETEEPQVEAPDSPEDWKEIYQWNYLPEDIRIAFESIGYNEEVWKTKSPPYTESLYWNELTSDQRLKATQLGYTQEGWDQVRDEKHGDQLALSNDNDNGDASSQTQQAMQITFKEEKIVPRPSPPPTVSLPTFQVSVAGPGEQATTGGLGIIPKTQPPRTPRPTPMPTPKPSRKPTPKMESTYTDDLVISSTKSDLYGYDDDIILTIGNEDHNVWLSQVFSVLASLCFLVLGILNWIRDEQVFHVCLVQGSVAMMFSSLVATFSETGSIIFQALAYHCYLLEGMYMLRLRTYIQPLDIGLDTLSISLWTADGLFGAGALIGVIMGYWQISNADAVFEVDLAVGKLLSACFWLISSVICFLSTFVLSRKINAHKEENQQQDDDRSDSRTNRSRSHQVSGGLEADSFL